MRANARTSAFGRHASKTGRMRAKTGQKRPIHGQAFACVVVRYSEIVRSSERISLNQGRGYVKDPTHIR